VFFNSKLPNLYFPVFVLSHKTKSVVTLAFGKEENFFIFCHKIKCQKQKKFQEKQRKKLLWNIITISFLLKKTQELILKLCKQRKSYQKKKFSLIFANSNDKKRKKELNNNKKSD